MVNNDKNVKLKIGKKEIDILNILSRNAKKSLRDIAKQVGASFITVRNKILSLEKNGVIKRYSVNLDYEKIGYDIHVLIDVRISKGKLFELEKKLAQSPNIYAVYDTTGEFDAVLLGRFKSTRTMDLFLKNIQSFDFIERTKTRLILNTIKDEKIKL